MHSRLSRGPTATVEAVWMNLLALALSSLLFNKCKRDWRRARARRVEESMREIILPCVHKRDDMNRCRYLPSQPQNPWIQSEMKSSLPKFKLCHISFYIITISMRALWLVNQLWVVVPVNPRKNSASSELLYKSNRPQVSVGYRLINHLECW